MGVLRANRYCLVLGSSRKITIPKSPETPGETGDFSDTHFSGTVLALSALVLGVLLAGVALGSTLAFLSARPVAAAGVWPVEVPARTTALAPVGASSALSGLAMVVSGSPPGTESGPILAQQPFTFTLTGLVLDCAFDPVEGVSITLEGTIFKATTDANGEYNLGTFELAAGSYVITASKSGYGVRSQRIALTEADLLAGTREVNFSSAQMCLQPIPASIFPGLRIQLPVLDTINCETWVQVQNTSDRNWTKAITLIWGPPSSCAPQSAGPIKVECSGLIAPGSSWSYKGSLMPAGSRSAVVYSMSTDAIINPIHGDPDIFADGVCERIFETVVSDDDDWRRFDNAFRNFSNWEGWDFGAHIGQPLAVSVNRSCQGNNTPGLPVQGAYPGISEWMEGMYAPAGAYTYYAPLIWATFGPEPRDWSSVLHIQNSGNICTSVEVWYQAQGDCARAVIDDILSLAGGESAEMDPNRVVGPGFQGSAWIRSSQPLGVIVDHIGMDMFMSYRAFPANVSSVDAVPPGGDLFTAGSLVNYAPLIYREFNGWDTGIQVQNLSSIHNAKVRVQFLDVDGGVVNTLTDWVCPRGAQTFFLPAIAWPNFAFEYVGSARIDSQDWGWPGDPRVDAPFVMSVVNLVKYQNDMRTAALEALSYNAFSEPEVFNWSLGYPNLGFPIIAIPFLAHATDEVGFGGPPATTEIAIQNINPNAGVVNYAVFIYDQAGLIDRVCGQISSREVDYIDIDRWAIIEPGFLGSMLIKPTFWTHAPALAAVAVERVGRVLTDPDIPGDESKGFEGFPAAHVFEFDSVCGP